MLEKNEFKKNPKKMNLKKILKNEFKKKSTINNNKWITV